MVRIRLIILAICLSSIHCIRDSSTSSSGDSHSYTPLNSGDVTQLISVNDSSTVLLEIGDQVKRSDSLTVYEKILHSGSGPVDISYQYTDGEFLIDTNLDSTENTKTALYSLNPFVEQRLAESFPMKNDTWLRTAGHSDSSYFKARKMITFMTGWGEISDVFAFDLFNKSGGLKMSIYYAEGLGWVGTTTHTGNMDHYFCCYKKIGSKIWGELKLAKDSDVHSPADTAKDSKIDLTGSRRL
jgi:hypothetical protein